MQATIMSTDDKMSDLNVYVKEEPVDEKDINHIPGQDISLPREQLPEGSIPIGSWDIAGHADVLLEPSDDTKEKECDRCGVLFDSVKDYADHLCHVQDTVNEQAVPVDMPLSLSSANINPECELFECTKCRLLFKDVDGLKEHKCLGYLNEAERKERKKRRIVKVSGHKAADDLLSEKALSGDKSKSLYENSEFADEACFSDLNKQRRRGRPSKNSVLKLEAVGNHLSRAKKTGRKRGRPPKVNGTSQKKSSEDLVPKDDGNTHSPQNSTGSFPDPVVSEMFATPDNDPKAQSDDNPSQCDDVTEAISPDSSPVQNDGLQINQLPADEVGPLQTAKVAKKIKKLKPMSKGLTSQKSRRPLAKATLEDLTCKFCGKTCRKPYELRVHERQHTNERPFLCPHCPKRYTSGSCLNKHIQYSHVGDNLKCKECDVKFDTKELLKEHCDTMGHTIQWPFQCDQCEKSYHKRRQLENHKLTHKGIKPFKCSVCDSSFATKASLVLHSYTHTGDRPFECEICGMRFLTRYLLNTHKMNHTGERPHLCDFCGKGFKLAAQLRSHREVHRKDKPFVCEICGKKFKWRYNMQEHTKIHSESAVQKTARFFCAVCGKGYYHRAGLEYHERTHTGEKPYKCARCHKKFRHNAHLQKHLARLHHLTMTLKPLNEVPGARTFREEDGVKAFSCDKCVKRFKHQTTLEKHMRKYHGVCLSYDEGTECEPPPDTEQDQLTSSMAARQSITTDNITNQDNYCLNSEAEDLTNSTSFTCNNTSISIMPRTISSDAAPSHQQPLSNLHNLSHQVFTQPQQPHLFNSHQTTLIRPQMLDQRALNYSDYFNMVSGSGLISFPSGFPLQMQNLQKSPDENTH